MGKLEKKNNRIKSLYDIHQQKAQIKCQYPVIGGCNKPVINSHSIQKGGPLKTLADSSNHVIMLNVKFKGEDEPLLRAKPIGVNKATIFNGLCDYHDDMVFACIEKTHFEPQNKKHLFLFSYRCFLKEYYEKLKQAQVTLKTSKLISEKDYDGNVQSQLYHQYASGVLQANYDLELVKLEYNMSLDNSDWDRFCYWSRLLKEPCKFSVSSYFSPDFDFEGRTINNFSVGETVYILTLTIIPFGDCTFVSISTLKPFWKQISSICNRLEIASDSEFKLLLSELVLRYCENIAFSPSHWDKLGVEKQSAILEFFDNNIFDVVEPFPGELANLFMNQQI